MAFQIPTQSNDRAGRMMRCAESHSSPWRHDWSAWAGHRSHSPDDTLVVRLIWSALLSSVLPCGHLSANNILDSHLFVLRHTRSRITKSVPFSSSCLTSSGGNVRLLRMCIRKRKIILRHFVLLGSQSVVSFAPVLLLYQKRNMRAPDQLIFALRSDRLHFFPTDDKGNISAKTDTLIRNQSGPFQTVDDVLFSTGNKTRLVVSSSDELSTHLLRQKIIV